MELPAHDRQTLDLYDSRPEQYAEWSSQPEGPSFRTGMIERLPAGASVLDFGCGAGWDSLAFKKAGLDVAAIDGSRGLVEVANRERGIGAVCMTFDQFDRNSEFDGVWASFTLQHVPRRHLPDMLARLFRALKPGGIIHIGMHRGSETRCDSLGRLYCHQEPEELTAAMENAGFIDIAITTSSGKGYDGTTSRHLHLQAAKPVVDRG